MIIFAYLMGSISSAIIVCKLMRLGDPRTTGSRNPGASNVLRIGGKFPAFLTLIGDVLKGVIPVVVAESFGFSNMTVAMVGGAAFLGHLYPLFFGFEGGKGVATIVGVILVLSWQTGLCCIATWTVIAILTRYASVSSIITSILAPFFIWAFTQDIYYTGAVSIMALILIYRHRKNIQNLRDGIEHKLGQKN